MKPSFPDVKGLESPKKGEGRGCLEVRELCFATQVGFPAKRRTFLSLYVARKDVAHFYFSSLRLANYNLNINRAPFCVTNRLLPRDLAGTP